MIIIGFSLLFAALSFNAIINNNQETIIGAFSRQAREQFNLDLTIGELSPDFPFSISLNNVLIRDDKGKDLIRIQNVMIRADWLKLLNKPNEVITAIHQVEINDPTVMLEFTDGELQWLKILKARPEVETKIPWEQVNLRVIIDNCRIQTLFLEKDTDPSSVEPVDIPMYLNADLILADKKLVLHPKLKVFWFDKLLNSYNQNNRDKNEPMISIRGVGDIFGDVLLNGEIHVDNLESIFNTIKLFEDKIENWELLSNGIDGRFDLQMTEIASRNPRFNFEFEAKSPDITLKTPLKPMEKVQFSRFNVRYSFPLNMTQFDITASQDDLKIDGYYQIHDFKTGKVSGNFKLNSVPIDMIFSRSRFKPEMDGLLDADISVEGTYKSPVLSGRLDPTELDIYTRKFTLEEGTFNFSEGNLSINQLSMISPENGELTVNGKGNIFTNNFDFSIDGKKVDIGLFVKFINLKYPIQYSGYSDFSSMIEIRSGEYKAYINVDSQPGRIMNLDYENIRGNIEVVNDICHLRDITVRHDTGGLLKVSGVIGNKGKLDLKFESAGIDVSGFFAENGNSRKLVEGIFFGDGTITGSFSNPSISFDLRAYDGKISSWQFEYGEFKAVLTNDGIGPFYAKLTATGSEIEINAEYIYSSKKPLTIWGVWKNLPLSSLTSRSTDQNVRVSGSGSFTGDFTDLNGVLKMAFDGNDVLGNRISTPYNLETLDLYDPFDYAGSGEEGNEIFFGWFLNIDIAGLSRFESPGQLIRQLQMFKQDFVGRGFIENGTLEVTGGLRFESLAKESESSILLSTLKNDILPGIPGIQPELPDCEKPGGIRIPLDGILALDMKVKRESDLWLLDGKAEGVDFVVNKEKVELLDVTLGTSLAGEYKLTADFSQGEGKLSVNGSMDMGELLGNSPVNLAVGIHSYPVRSLLNLAGIRTDPGTFDGSMNGNGELTGSILKPRLENVKIAFESAMLFGIPIKDNSLEFSWEGARLSLKKFELSDGADFHAIAVGTLELDPSRISNNRISVIISNLPLASLNKSGLMNSGLEGNLSLTSLLEYDQNTSVPQISLTMEIDKPGFKWIKLDKIVGEGVIDGKTGNLKLGKALGEIGGSKIELNGFIRPKDTWRNLELDLYLKADNYNLEPLVQQMKLPLKGENMKMWMDLNLTGSSSHPTVNGKIKAEMKNPGYDMISMADSAGVEVAFKNNIASIDGRLSKKDRSLVATGNFDIYSLLAGLSSEKLPANKPLIEISNLDNQPFPFNNFGFNVDVLLKGKNGSDKMQLIINDRRLSLKGGIDLVSGMYRISPIPMTPSGSTQSPVDLDLMVNLFDGFPVESGNVLEIKLEKSSLNIQGSPAYPVASGEIVIKEGVLRLLDRTFTINKAKLQFKEFLGIDNPYLNGEATTVIVSRSIRNFRGSENLVVTAKLNARLRQLTSGIQFTSNRGSMTESDLMGILLRQDIFDEFQTEGLLTTLQSQAFTIPGAFLSRYFESKGGFRLFQIGVDSSENVFLNMEYETLNDVFLDYYHLFDNNSPEFDVFLKYKFRDDSFVGLGSNEDGGIIFKIDYVIPIK